MNRFFWGMQVSYLALNGPASDAEMMQSVESIVSALFCVVVSMGTVPIIRCSRDHAAQVGAPTHPVLHHAGHTHASTFIHHAGHTHAACLAPYRMYLCITPLPYTLGHSRSHKSPKSMYCLELFFMELLCHVWSLAEPNGRPLCNYPHMPPPPTSP